MTVRFPHAIVIENNYHYMAECEKLLRHLFGHKDGNCDWDWCEDYEVDQNELQSFIESVLQNNIAPTEQAAREIAMMFGTWQKPHSHTGMWATKWVKKTGYGQQMFYFRSQADLDRFNTERKKLHE